MSKRTENDTDKNLSVTNIVIHTCIVYYTESITIMRNSKISHVSIRCWALIRNKQLLGQMRSLVFLLCYCLAYCQYNPFDDSILFEVTSLAYVICLYCPDRFHGQEN